MRILLISILGLLTLASCTKQEPMEALIDRVFTVAEQQYTAMDTRLTEKTLPRTLSADGEFVPSNIYWWCSGFYPGSLWYIYEYTGNEAVKTLAEKNTLKLDSIQYVTRDHDVGFQLNCSYGNAFRLTMGKKKAAGLAEWKRAKEAVELLGTTLRYGGIFIALVQLVSVSWINAEMQAEDGNIWWMTLAIASLPILYGYAVSILLLPIGSRISIYIIEYMQKPEEGKDITGGDGK